MPLAPGVRLGAYEIVGLIGAGGMGEVYRARDTRLGRDVAIKVLPAGASADPERLARFEQEARAAAALNHPNILAVFDIGAHDSAPYIVSELLEGETLRERLAQGALTVRKALDYAIQIAHGLAAAHEKSIVHRDLKPDNLFISRDGRIKILDFGLAKLIVAPSIADTVAPTRAPGTHPGTVLGTVGYMSPEQVRAQTTDHRTDIFAFGAILYEMLSGHRAFTGDSAIETMNAIIKEDPPELVELSRTSGGLERLVRRCLEKDPNERFYSAHDLAFALEAVSGGSSQTVPAVTLPATRRRRLMPSFVAVGLLAAAASAFVAGRRTVKVDPPSVPAFHRLTFRRGQISGARLAPDGHTMIYAAALDGSSDLQLYSARPESPESQKLNLPAGDILSIDANGEMAIKLRIRVIRGFAQVGTLARVPLAGGAPRDMLEDVQDADWTPGGGGLAVSRFAGGRYRVEYPIGKVLYENSGWISHVRISPDGQWVAFLDHPLPGDDRGSVMVVDRNGKSRTLTKYFDSGQGLVWRSADEVWFTAAYGGNGRSLHAVTLAGVERTVMQVPATLKLDDASRDGRLLLESSSYRLGFIGVIGGAKERDLSWLDWSQLNDLSQDGKTVLFTEQGDGAGPGYSVYIRPTDGSPAVRLGTGQGLALSSDGKWVLAQDLRRSPAQLMLLPTGAGEAKQITNDGINHANAAFFPDGHRILFNGNEPDHALRTYIQDLAGGPPRPITAEGTVGLAVSPDGKSILCRSRESGAKSMLCPVDGGEPRPIPGFLPTDGAIRWTADGRFLFVRDTSRAIPQKVYRLDVATGRREPWLEVTPSASSGVSNIGGLILSADGKSYVYGYGATLSDLYLVEGLK
jgi:Tol biopolymer transport system component